jgi:hypothetical protein
MHVRADKFAKSKKKGIRGTLPKEAVGLGRVFSSSSSNSFATIPYILKANHREAAAFVCVEDNLSGVCPQSAARIGVA